jgi:thiol-disulfide isomerase/thioredoxin
MGRININTLMAAVAVMALIVGSIMHFINHSVAKAVVSVQQQQQQQKAGRFFPSTIGENGMATQPQIYKTQFKIDKSQFRKAPAFTQITGYINTPGLIKISDLRGKVVLVHFWTYTCINCIHTIPYLNDWYQKYSNKGLVIVSIHRPEFEFEKNIDNVKAAVQQYEIKYPVLQDNNYGTWDAYGNLYWPRDYLIDNQGLIRYNHVGEGGYDQTEKTIQSLLVEGTY